MPSQGSLLPPSVRAVALRRKLLPLLMAAALTPQAQAADLVTIMHDALENNAELASSRSLFDSVEAAREVERADLLPQVNAGAEAAHNRIYESQGQTATGGEGQLGGLLSRIETLEQEAGITGSGANGLGSGLGLGLGTSSDDNYNSVNASIQITQALFDATHWYQWQQAGEEIDQQALLLESDRQQLLYDVANAYFEILRARDILAARVAQERAIERQLEQSREQFEVGLIAITDVHEAQATADLARAQRIAAESDLQISFEALERLTGQRYDSIEGLADALPVESPQPGSRDAWVSLAMENNPALLAAREAIEIADSNVDIVRAGHLPTLDAFARYNYANSDRDNVTGHDSGSVVGLSANLPVYTGGRTRAQTHQQTYLLEAAQYDFESQRRATTQQVRSLFTQVVNDVQRVEAQHQAIVSNRSALEATRSGYEVGTRNIVDVLNAEQNLYNAMSNYAEARFAYVIDLLALRQQTGVLDASNIAALNEWLQEENAVSLALPEGDSGQGERLNIGEPPQPPRQ